MFGILGGKKQGASPQRRVPTERVSSLASRGVPEPEIIKILKDEGYTPIEVDKAMTQALQGAVGGKTRRPEPVSMEPDFEEPLADMPPPDYPPADFDNRQGRRRTPEPPPMEEAADLGPERDFQPRSRRRAPIDDVEDEFQPPEPRMPAPPEVEEMREIPRPPEDENMMRGPLDLPEIPGRPDLNKRMTDYAPARRGAAPPEEYDEQPRRYRPGMPPEEQPIQRLPERRSIDERKDDKRRAIEELTESIIEEKWASIQASMTEFENKIALIENKVDLLDTSIKRLEGDKKQDMNNIEDKIDTYRSAIGEMSGRVESVESAMKSTMTPLMQSMRELSDTIKTMKKSQ